MVLRYAVGLGFFLSFNFLMMFLLCDLSLCTCYRTQPVEFNQSFWLTEIFFSLRSLKITKVSSSNGLFLQTTATCWYVSSKHRSAHSVKSLMIRTDPEGSYICGGLRRGNLSLFQMQQTHLVLLCTAFLQVILSSNTIINIHSDSKNLPPAFL